MTVSHHFVQFNCRHARKTDFASKQGYSIKKCNVASQKLLGRLGFKKEGVLRKSVFVRGEWRHLALYGILREEWKEPEY
jgi:L-amino acid N-acyltransferase YncA